MDSIVEAFLKDVAAEYRRARNGLHEPMNSGHEAYGVILEELEEYWDLVKADKDRSPAGVAELVQVAAMAMAAALEVCQVEPESAEQADVPAQCPHCGKGLIDVTERGDDCPHLTCGEMEGCGRRFKFQHGKLNLIRNKPTEWHRICEGVKARINPADGKLEIGLFDAAGKVWLSNGGLAVYHTARKTTLRIADGAMSAVCWPISARKMWPIGWEVLFRVESARVHDVGRLDAEWLDFAKMCREVVMP